MEAVIKRLWWPLLALFLAVPARAGFLINAAVLERHGYTLEEYNALSPAGRTDVREWIRAREAQKEWSVSVGLEDGRPKSIMLQAPKRDLSLEIGKLNPAGNDPLLGESPYINLRQSGSSSGKRLDWGYDAQLGYLDLKARYGEDVPYESEGLFLGSALGRVGRAYNLFGPFDVGWSVMGLMRIADVFPNLTLDETLGARWRYDENHAIGLFTGWTENLTQERIATHNALAFWGDFKNGLGYWAEAARQQNPLTDATSLETRLSIPSRIDRLSIYARIEEEGRGSLEFRRRRTSLGGEFALSRSWDMDVGIGVDEIDFGGVEVESKSLMLTFSYRPEKGPSRIRIESGFGPDRDYQLPEAGELVIAKKLYDGLVRLDAALARLRENLSGIDAREAARSLSSVIAGLDPSLREALEEEWGALDPDDISPERVQKLLDRVSAGVNEARTELARTAALAGDQAFLERLAVRAARKEIYGLFGKKEIDILGKTVRITPTKLIALAHAYRLGLSPLPPVTGRDVGNWLNDNCAGSAAQLRDCLLVDLPPEQRAALEEAFGNGLDAALEQSVGWAAGIVQREINRILLNVMLASERLDALTVGGGRRVGELNRRALTGSFAALDERRSSRLGKAFTAARIKTAALTTTAERKSAMGRAAAGMQALQELMDGPAWPKDVEVAVAPEDWPRLLEFYSPPQILDFIQRAAAKISTPDEPGRRRLMLRFEGRPGMGVSIAKGGHTTLNLPPVADGRDPNQNLKILLAVL